VTVLAEFSRAGRPFALAVPWGQPGLTESMHLLTLNDDGRPVLIARIGHVQPGTPQVQLTGSVPTKRSVAGALERSGVFAAVLGLWHALVDGVPLDEDLGLRLAMHPDLIARFAAHGWEHQHYRSPRWFRS
jgi:hypothetical protein